MAVLPAPDALAVALREARRLMEHRPAVALAHALRAADLAVVQGDERAAAWARMFEARARSYMGELEEGFRLAAPMAEVFEGLRDLRGVPYAMTDLSVQLAERGDISAARAAIDRGIASARQCGDLEAEIGLHQNRSAVSLVEGDPERARHECLTAIGVAAGTSDPCTVSHLNLVLIDLESLSDRPFGPARERLATEAVAFAAQAVARCGDQRLRAVQALGLQAEALAWAGNGDRAVTVAMNAVHLATDMGREITAWAESSRAVALAAVGRRAAALVSARIAVEGATEGGDTWRNALRIREVVDSGALGSR